VPGGWEKKGVHGVPSPEVKAIKGGGGRGPVGEAGKGKTQEGGDKGSKRFGVEGRTKKGGGGPVTWGFVGG